MAFQVVGRLDAASIADFDSGAEDKQALELDLRRVTFASPVGLIALCVKIESVLSVGHPVRVHAPADSSVAHYLSRTRLPAQLDTIGATHDFVAVQEHNLGIRLVEIQRFDDAQLVETLAQSVYAFAEPASTETASQLHIAVCEAGENVLFHSGNRHGYLMAQYFPGNRSFEFALGDSGVGLLGSLATCGANDNHAAIELAVTPGISSTGDPGRGYGLSSIRSSLAEMGGSLTLYAGNSYQSFASTVGESQSRGSFAGQLRGSLVSGRLPTT